MLVWRLMEGPGRNMRLVQWFGLTGQRELVRKGKAAELEQPVGTQEEAVRTPKEEAVRTQDASILVERAVHYYHTRRIHYHLYEIVAVVAFETKIGRGMVARRW